MLDDMALVETQDLLSARPLGQDTVVPQRTIRKRTAFHSPTLFYWPCIPCNLAARTDELAWAMCSYAATPHCYLSRSLGLLRWLSQAALVVAVAAAVAAFPVPRKFLPPNPHSGRKK